MVIGNRMFWAVLAVLPALLGGCKSFCLNTKVRMSSDTAVLKDGSPLHPMPVTGGCSSRKVALIDVDGVLLNTNLNGLGSAGENPVEMFREKLDTVARSGCYAAVVVRINSPGGGVTASDIMRRDLMAFKARTSLPVVACLMDLGAGGAYYLATACDQIMAHPTTITGGMGVIFNMYDMQDTLLQINLKARPIRSGKLIDVGSPVFGAGRDMNDMDDMAEVQETYNEGVAVLQAVAAQFHDRYRQVVCEARGLNPGLEELFDGRVFTAAEALPRRLIDSVGYVDDALQVARQLGGAPDAPAVILHRCKDPARTPYAITPNVPRTDLLPVSMPGLERTRLPTFLYMWQPDPTLERWGGR